MRVTYGLQRRIANTSLKKKFVTIMIISLSIMAIMSFVSVEILSSAYNKMLYQTIADSMSYSAKEIADYMRKIESLSEMFLSDEKIQHELIKIKDNETNKGMYRKSIYNLNIYLGTYYQNYSDGILKNMSLYTPVTVLKTNLLAADQIDAAVQRDIQFNTSQKSGAPYWHDKHMSEYGIIMARDIRRIERLQLDTLGTLLFNIDMESLVKTSTEYGDKYGEPGYVISSNNKILFCTNNLSQTVTDINEFEEVYQYKVVQIEDTRYFVARGTISEYGWDYYSLLPYEDIGGQIEKIRKISFFIIVVDFVIVIYLIIKIIGRILIHISALKDRMQKFSIDNTKVPECEYDYSERNDEIGLLNRQFNEMSETTVKLIHNNYINEILKKDAQIKILESQINPHFLYNTLDSIKWRAKSIGEKNISSMVESLGVLLRTSLSRKNEHDYTIGREMSVIDAYVTIQKLRYEERLLFRNEISPDFYNYKLLKMAVQPLIENAVFYGLDQNVDECTIVLSANQYDGVLHIFVRNSGSEFEENLLDKLEREEVKPNGNGVGLLNIERRVKIQYGEQYGLRLYNEDDFAVAELIIPLEIGDD